MFRWSDGWVVKWSGGQVVRWPAGQVVRWSHLVCLASELMVMIKLSQGWGWSGGQVTRWSGGQVVITVLQVEQTNLKYKEQVAKLCGNRTPH